MAAAPSRTGCNAWPAHTGCNPACGQPLGRQNNGTIHEGILTILRIKAISSCRKAKLQHKEIEHSAWTECQDDSKTIQRQAGFHWRACWQALGQIYSGNQEFSKATHPRPFVPKGGLVNPSLKPPKAVASGQPGRRTVQRAFGQPSAKLAPIGEPVGKPWYRFTAGIRSF